MVQLVSQVTPYGAMVTLPLPLPALIRVKRGAVVVLKLAVTSTALLPAAMMQLPVPLQAPLQPVKVLPAEACATSVTTALLVTTGQERVQFASQVKPGGVMVTLPVPLPALFRTNGRDVAVGLKLAVTLALLEPAGMVQVPVPLQTPLQPENVLPLAACATRVTAVLLAKLVDALAQSAAQLKPAGLLVTLPVPVPDLLSETVRVPDTVVLKLAVMLALLVSAGIVQLPVPLQAPLHPTNVLPLAACATRVTDVLLAKLDEAMPQSAAQIKPLGLLVTLPVPVPDLLSVIRRCTGAEVKLAVTLRALSILTLQLSAVPLQAPLQPVKLLPDAACAVNVTGVPAV